MLSARAFVIAAASDRSRVIGASAVATDRVALLHPAIVSAAQSAPTALRARDEAVPKVLLRTLLKPSLAIV